MLRLDDLEVQTKQSIIWLFQTYGFDPTVVCVNICFFDLVDAQNVQASDLNFLQCQVYLLDHFQFRLTHYFHINKLHAQKYNKPITLTREKLYTGLEPEDLDVPYWEYNKMHTDDTDREYAELKTNINFTSGPLATLLKEYAYFQHLKNVRKIVT